MPIVWPIVTIVYYRKESIDIVTSSWKIKKSLEAEEEAKRERIQAQKQKHREEQRIKVP